MQGCARIGELSGPVVCAVAVAVVPAYAESSFCNDVEAE